MRKLNVSTLVTLDGVIQDPGGFQELDEGGWGNRYFDAEAQSYALEHLRESDSFVCGRITHEAFKKFWPQVKEGEYAQTLIRMPKFVASKTLTEPLDWNATLLKGDVADAVADLKQQGSRHRDVRQREPDGDLDGSRSDRRVPDLDPSLG